MLVPGFSRVGNHPALDLLNSVVVDRGKTIDWIGDGHALRAWLDGSGVLSPREDADPAGWSQTEFEVLARDIRALREDLRQFLVLRAQSATFDSSKQDVSFVNQRMAITGLVQVLVAGDDRWELQLRRGIDSPAAVLSELAAVCASLIANCSPFQVRRCENPACTMWFYDNRRGPPRRWCSMPVCGNRVKAITHRRLERHRAAKARAAVPEISADPP